MKTSANLGMPNVSFYICHSTLITVLSMLLFNQSKISSLVYFYNFKYSIIHLKRYLYNIYLEKDTFLRPSFPGHDLIFLSKFNSQVMWNLLFEPLIGNFKSDVKFLIWIFFLWQLISCQTLKLRPKINVCKKNQISDRKIKSCWIDLIWNLLLDLTWFIFAVFDVKSFWLLIFMWQGKRALFLFIHDIFLSNIEIKT